MSPIPIRALDIDCSPQRIAHLVAIVETHVKEPNGPFCVACDYTGHPCGPLFDTTILLRDIRYAISNEPPSQLRDAGDYVRWLIDEIARRERVQPHSKDYERAQSSLPDLWRYLGGMRQTLAALSRDEPVGVQAPRGGAM